MIDPDLELFTYHNTKTGEVRYFSPEEADEQPDADDWQKGPQIKPAGEPLRLAANRAQELGVATHVVDSFDEFKQLYGFEHDPRVAEPNWALELVEALSSPALAVMLLVIGFVGIYVELHTPGVGVGAFVAALAFMLFFWSNFLHGTAGWLEVLLFLGGVAFLLLELLILPGFGVFGLGGGAMILASLVLASQTFVLPQTELQRAELRHSLTIVAAATLCVIAAAMLLRRYLPYAPVFRTLLLNPTARRGIGRSRLSRSAGRFLAPDRPTRHGHDQSHAGRQGRLRRPAGRRHRRRPADRPRPAGGRRQDTRQPRGGPHRRMREPAGRAVALLLTPVQRKADSFSRVAANSRVGLFATAIIDG